jgi:hypothetical protein
MKPGTNRFNSLRPTGLTESDVTGQLKAFMEAKGWRPIRMQRTIVPGQFSTCEPGTADFLFLYYAAKGAALALWIELKKPKARMTCKCLQNRGTRKRCTMCDQINWRTKERARGAVVWAGVDDIAVFIEAYEKSYGWLHAGAAARGQLDLLAGIKSSA